MALFCLLHGKWHDSSCWGALIRPLEARGHDVIAPDLPFEDPELGYEARARPAVEALTGARDAVLVAHSLGVAYAPLVTREQPVSRLVYLCPAPVGPFAATEAATAPIRPGFPFPADDARGVSVWDPDAAMAAMYPRLPGPTARALARRLRPGSSPAEPYPSGSLLDLPVELVLSTQDEFFSPEWSREVAHLVFGVRPVELDELHDDQY